MNKKAIAILGAIFLLIVGTLGFLIFAKYSGKNSSPPPSNTPLTQNQTATSTNTGSNLATTTPVGQPSQAVVKLSDDQVVAPILFFNGQGITYFDNQGNLYQSTLQDNNGQLQLADKKQLNIPPKPNITNVLWPAKGSDFIAQFTNSSGQPAWSYFNSTTQTYTDLPSQVESVGWMPNGTQIMYIWLENNKATLNISNPDTTNWKDLADMWENDDEIHVSPDGSQILYFETNSASSTNAINSVTTDGKIWKGLVTNGQNYGVLWSPDSQKFLFAKKDLETQAYQLWVYNLTSGEIVNLGLFTTPSKAVWASDSNTIYAAVPSSAPSVGNALTTDNFFKMDITTLQKTQYSSGGNTPLDGQDLFLNSTGDKLLFKNAQDGGLYYLDLSQQSQAQPSQSAQ